ncbi:MAG TPA: SDR family oxidoreductase [Gemmataceae bacterium]|nr:SDR family oxidoreductase [Gemmataceae bacterium]
MSESGYILLTGATGFLGRYLLRGLLACGQRVAVLVRDGRAAPAEERVRELTSLESDAQRDRPANPVVLAGDVCAPRLGLGIIDRIWLARHCVRAVHAAADVSLRRSFAADPWQTNVEGTQRLLDLCPALGIREFHHVSTAFVCGQRAGPVKEEELDRGQSFHNDYEESKFEAERRVRQARHLLATVYRPSVIVGDSHSGYTSSYHGFYRFLELGTRLAVSPSPPLPAPAGSPAPAAGGTGRRVLPLCLPFTGDEPRNLVPVDWVAQAIVAIVNQPRLHGRTYHLVAQTPVPVRDIKAVAEEVLAIDGVRWAGPGSRQPPTPLEELFLDQVREYWPYLHGDPVFDCRNTRTALPRLPAPGVDRAMLARLIRFAVADQWGRSGRKKSPPATGRACASYVESFFPESLRRSSLGRIPVDVTVGLDVAGAGGGRWSCRLRGGEPMVRRGLAAEAEVVYRMDLATFEAVVRGRLDPREAFLARRIEIEGDVEKGLKLAVLFDHFVKECPYAPEPHPEENDAVAGRA